MKRPPRAKQAEALERIKGRRNFALFLEMRVGKTKVVLDDWQRMLRAGACQDLLVIAPASVYKVWETAIDDDVDDDISALGMVYRWVSSESPKQQAHDLCAFMVYPGPRVLLMNTEAMSDVTAARDLCMDFTKQRPTTIVIDESTFIKNHTAKRTKFINHELGPLACARRILSGLPTPRSPLDIYAQMEFLDPSILGYDPRKTAKQNYDRFFYRYAIIKRKFVQAKSVREATHDNPFAAHGARSLGKWVPEVVGYKHLNELQTKVAAHSFRVLLSECADLPPSIYAPREVSITAEQRRLYDEMKRRAYAELDGHFVTAQLVIVQMLRLQQILLGRFVDDEHVTHEIKENRTAVLLEVLNETSEKVVIFCSYDADVEKITAALRADFGEGSVARYWGGNAKSRDAEETLFKTAPGCRFMVATAAAGGLGKNWSVANVVVFYSGGNNLEHRIQGESRPLDADKKQSVLYIDLICPGTIDELIVNALRKKLDLAAEITGDKWRKWLR